MERLQIEMFMRERILNSLNVHHSMVLPVTLLIEIFLEWKKAMDNEQLMRHIGLAFPTMTLMVLIKWLRLFETAYTASLNDLTTFYKTTVDWEDVLTPRRQINVLTEELEL